MVQRRGVGPEPAGDTGHDSVVGNRKASCEESRLSVVGAPRPAARSATKRGPRDSRNIAIALALLALAAVMFLVTMVKFEEQMYRNGPVQTRFDRNPPQVRGSATISNLFDLANGTVEDFDRRHGHVDLGDVAGSIAAATSPCSGRPEGSAGVSIAGLAEAECQTQPFGGLVRRQIIYAVFRNRVLRGFTRDGT